MADDATPATESGPADAAGPHVPIVIEGDTTEIHAAAGELPPEGTRPDAAAPETSASEPSAPPPGRAEASLSTRGSGVPFVSGIVGAVVGAAAALAAAWYFDPRAEPLRDLTARQSALEAVASRQTAIDKALDAGVRALEASQAGYAKAAAFDALDKRLAAVESAPASGAGAAAIDALDKRLAKLESGAVDPDAIGAIKAEAHAAREEAAKASALAAAAGSEKAASPASVPDPRVGELVTGEAALGDRIAKLEAALAAPKAETRAAATEVAPKRDDAAQAIAALALEQRLRAGEPFAAEWAALSRAGADAAALAALKPFTETGVPTTAALGATFAKIAPALAAAAAPEASDSGLDGLLDHMRKLVRVHAVGEIPGDDPSALISQIEAALSHGQVATALAAYARLPDGLRKAAGDWAKTAEARAGTDAAARSLREAAIGRLAGAKN